MSMKYASDHPELRKRIKVFLDGFDVTNVCDGFDVEAQQVRLYETDAAGKKIVEWECPGCKNFRLKETKEPPVCARCGLVMTTLSLRKRVYSGRVEVIPINPANEDLRT
jgi:hypothetical protein